MVVNFKGRKFNYARCRNHSQTTCSTSLGLRELRSERKMMKIAPEMTNKLKIHSTLGHFGSGFGSGSNLRRPARMPYLNFAFGSAPTRTLNLNAAFSSVRFRFGPISEPNPASTSLMYQSPQEKSTNILQVFEFLLDT